MPRPNDEVRLLQSIGVRVAELRSARGLTQEQLAEKVRLSVRYVQRIEAGRQNLTVATLARLGNLLGVRATALLKPARLRARRPGRPPRPAARSG